MMSTITLHNELLAPGVKLWREALITVILDVAPKLCRAILADEQQIRSDKLMVKGLQSAMSEIQALNRNHQKEMGPEWHLLQVWNKHSKICA
jgi:hypothetical protein